MYDFHGRKFKIFPLNNFSYNFFFLFKISSRKEKFQSSFFKFIKFEEKKRNQLWRKVELMFIFSEEKLAILSKEKWYRNFLAESLKNMEKGWFDYFQRIFNLKKSQVFLCLRLPKSTHKFSTLIKMNKYLFHAIRESLLLFFFFWWKFWNSNEALKYLSSL